MVAIAARSYEVEVTPAMRAHMERLFAQPILAPYRQDYLKAKEKGFEARAFRQYTVLTFDGCGIEFFTEGGAPRGFSSSNYRVIEGEPLPLPRLRAILDEAVAQLAGEPRPDLQYSMLANRYHVRARRVARGRPVADVFTATLNAVTGKLLSFGYEARVEVEPHGGDRTLPLETLRDAGYARLIQERPPLQQAELVQDEIVIGVADPGAGRVGVPVHRMRWMAPGGSYWSYASDARNGRVLGTYYAMAQGGAGEGPPYPERVAVGRVQGRLTPLPSALPKSGHRPVAVRAGKTVWFGHFAEATGTLYLRRAGDEAHRAFRPTPELRKALARQAAGAGRAPGRVGAGSTLPG